LVARAKSGPSTPGPAGPSIPGAASRPAGDDGLASSSETGSGSDDFFFLGRGEGGPAGGEAARKSRGRRANKDASRALAGEALTPEFDAHTAFWSPAVVTDEAGKGTLKFNLPEKSTRWRLTARGVSAETLVGDARAELVTKSDFFVELLTPLALVEGDQPRFAARVHNLTGKTGEAELVLTVRAGQQRRFQTARVTLGESAVVEHRFEALPGVDAADLELELKVEATLGDATAVATADDSIPVRPWGLELMDSASGSIADASTLWLELPDGRRYDHRRLELHIGPSVDRVLIEEALGQSPFPTRKLGGTSHAAVASDLVGTCAVLRSMQSSGGEQPEYAELRSRAAGLLASLAAAQSGDGGWPWVGRGSSSPMVSATVVLGLAAAQDAGLQPPAPTLTSASNFVRDAYRGAGSASYELRAALVHAQAALGQGDFSAANSLHRERNRLSPAALAHTVLALARMDRAPMAADVAALLENELKFDANTGRAQCSVEGNIAWSRSPVDMTALAVLALEAGLPRSTRIAAGVESLLASRPWSSQGERGLAVAAVAQFERENERLDDRATLTVAVGDADPIEVILERDGAGMHFVLPLAGDGRRVPLRFALEGRAAPHVAARLVGFTANLSALGKDPGFRVLSQSYHAEPRRYQGQSLPVGFGVLSNRSETWTNEVDHLELGGKTKVHVYVDRDRVPDGGIDDFLVVDIALPGGAKLLEGSLSGGVGSHEQRDGHLIVPLGQGSGRKLVSFELLGLEPGAYRQLPAVVHSAYEPGRRGIGKADALTVLGRGEASPDDYRPTPDELFHHGRLLFEHGDLAAAGGKLGQLYGDHEGNLRTSDLRALARMMLTASLDQRDAASA
ncbi:MAG: hypothetical protein O2816_20300, partial [Planctomycetota bacterium]|nr:hypothetical protein [Planctomycetota bacterium]